MNDLEQWRPANGFVGYYEVSNLGNIRSLDRNVPTTNRWGSCWRFCKGQSIRPRVNRWGYEQVSLTITGTKAVTISVHKLVALAFVGPKPSARSMVNHKDGVKTHNQVSNLEWVTQSENTVHAVRSGLIKTGEQSVSTRLSAKQVHDIRSRRASGEYLRAIAADYGMSVSGIHAIATGKNWKHLVAENEVRK
ncbi:MAG: NUMOD4 domain-containing protein [Solirubrobacterales bacterium]